MSNADSVRTKPVELKIGDKTYHLKYDFNAFIELEDEFGSIDKALNEVQGEEVLDDKGEKIPLLNDDNTPLLDVEGNQLYKRTTNLKAIRFLVWAGLLFENDAITLKDTGSLMEFSNMAYIFKCVMQAVTGSLPKKEKTDPKNQ